MFFKIFVLILPFLDIAANVTVTPQICSEGKGKASVRVFNGNSYSYVWSNG